MLLNELFDFQVDGSIWLADKRLGILGDEPGLGKSAQGVTAADLCGAQRICILGPSIARPVWVREFEKFSSLPRHFDVVYSKSHEPSTVSNLICSYDLALHYDPVAFGQFDLLILDEAHFLKNLNAKRTQKILGRDGYVRYAKRIWALTGTLAVNNYAELWPLLFTFGVTKYTYDQFVKNFCVSIRTGYGIQIVGSRTDKAPEIQKLLEPIMLRRTLKEVGLQIPELFMNALPVEAGPVDLSLEDREKIATEYSFLEEILAKNTLDVNDMKILEGLAQSVSTLLKYLGLQKVKGVVDTVKEEMVRGDYEKVVIFGSNRQVLENVFNDLKEFNPVMIYGGTSPKAKKEAEERFQTDPRCKVFVGNIEAAGSVITLTAANQEIFIQQDWRPGYNAQAAKRCQRIGQTKPVFIRNACIYNGVEERLEAILRRKTQELFELFDKKSLTPQNNAPMVSHVLQTFT